MQHLQQNTLLQGGKYKIERVLGQGGFGITYLATQELLDRKVCIKEFFFKEYCERDEATSHVSLGTQNSHEIVERFMTKFLKEARTISQLEHLNIIKIFDIFKENNTAYYVMEYIEGESLSDKVNHYGVLSELEAKDYINQVASALEYIHHRSINHLDIKPANIMVRRADNKAILIDFGLSKQYDTQGGQTSTTPVGISHGYAPMEQYNVGGVSTFSPQTDIYSLGATFYKLVTGNTPPQAGDILNDGLPELPSHLSQSVVKVIKTSMQARKLDRYNNIDEFLRGFDDVSQKTSFLQQEFQAQHNIVSDEETMIMGDTPAKVKDDSAKTTKSSLQGNVKISEVEENGSKKGWIVMLVIAVILGIIGYNFVENKNEERARMETAYNKKQEDKQKYLKLMGEGDKLLLGGYYTESVVKYEQALTYETMYSNTQYVAEFSKGAANKITEAKQKHEAVADNRTHGVINGHEWVDLGLSSDVKWATCNVGAVKESDFGRYIYSPSVSPYEWNGWRFPTKKEYEELLNDCTWIWKCLNGHAGYLVIGPNGNSIFLPASGNEGTHANEKGWYWTSTPFDKMNNKQNVLYINQNDKCLAWSLLYACMNSARLVVE